MSTIPGSGLPSPRGADPLRCYLQMPKSQERALPSFPKLFNSTTVRLTHPFLTVSATATSLYPRTDDP